MPFSDDDGYYARDPKSATTRTDDQISTFASHMLDLTQGIEALALALPPEQRDQVDQVRIALTCVQGDSAFLAALMRELAAYNAQLIDQRQSSRDAYNRGWDESRKDILSRLHPADHQMLTWILQHLDAEDRAASETLEY